MKAIPVTSEDVIVWMNCVRRIEWEIADLKRKYRRAQLKAHNVKHRSTLEGYRLIIGALTKEKQTASLARERVIGSLADATYQKLLTSRYILYKPWRDVAEDISYDLEYTRSTLHRRALAETARLDLPLVCNGGPI